MINQESHTMELAQTYASGAEEWVCPTCERRFVVQWPPQYKKIILEPGDEYAIHGGGKGGIVIQPPGIEESEETFYLADHWHEAFDDLDFGDWPDLPYSDKS